MARGPSVVEGDGAGLFYAIHADAHRLKPLDRNGKSESGDEGRQVTVGEVVLSKSIAEGGKGHGGEEERPLLLQVGGKEARDRLTQAGQAGVEGMEEGIVLQGPDLLFEFGASVRGESVETTEIEDGAGPGAVIPTPVFQHVIVRVALDGLRGEIHVGALVNPTYEYIPTTG